MPVEFSFVDIHPKKGLIESKAHFKGNPASPVPGRHGQQHTFRHELAGQLRTQ